MTARYSFTRKSGNRKVGPIPVARAPRSTCPPDCPLKDDGGCYAELGRVRIAWDRQESEGISFAQLLEHVRDIPPGSLWRYGEAGDLPGRDGIDAGKLAALVTANAGKRGFCYTHKKGPTDAVLVYWANARGFTVNYSADSLDEADRLLATRDAPVTCVVPSWERRPSFRSPAGNQVTTCPAAIRDDIDCSRCGLCAIPHRHTIVAFPAHSQRHRRIDERLER